MFALTWALTFDVQKTATTFTFCMTGPPQYLKFRGVQNGTAGVTPALGRSGMMPRVGGMSAGAPSARSPRGGVSGATSSCAVRDAGDRSGLSDGAGSGVSDGAAVHAMSTPSPATPTSTYDRDRACPIAGTSSSYPIL